MKGRLHLELRDTGGRRLAVRRGDNSVLRSGGQLVAELFAGRGAPITHMGVGTNGEPESEDFSTEALTTGGDEPLQAPEVEIAPEAFSISEDPARRVMVVKLRATLPPEAAEGTLREAGLMAERDGALHLYNRVTFAPIQKGGDHELTLFWEVTFPYGDLQWLT